MGLRKGLDDYLEAPVRVSLINDSVNIRFKKYFKNSKSPSSYVITLSFIDRITIELLSF